jgi:MoaA/NifB/PqqE/SkfB family radical SAM enzyme
MSGGEPFLYNNFIAFCEALTERHCIGLNTNLSTANVELFAETIKPEKVSYIWAAVHLDERLKLDKGIEKFASRYLLLCEKGFKVNAIYVLHPTKIDIFEKELLFIKNFGISSLQVKVFKGVFKGKTYPEAFPDKVRDKILRNSGGYLNNAFYLDGETNFKGVLCKAGMTFFKLFEDGKVERCASDNEDYGNLFKGTFKRDLYPLPCKRQKVKALSQCKRFII